jgi:hypothetical protein
MALAKGRRVSAPLGVGGGCRDSLSVRAFEGVGLREQITAFSAAADPAALAAGTEVQ